MTVWNFVHLPLGVTSLTRSLVNGLGFYSAFIATAATPWAGRISRSRTLRREVPTAWCEVPCSWRPLTPLPTADRGWTNNEGRTSVRWTTAPTPLSMTTRRYWLGRSAFSLVLDSMIRCLILICQARLSKWISTEYRLMKVNESKVRENIKT